MQSLADAAQTKKLPFFPPVRCFLWTLQPINVAFDVSMSVQVRRKCCLIDKLVNESINWSKMFPLFLFLYVYCYY